MVDTCHEAQNLIDKYCSDAHVEILRHSFVRFKIKTFRSSHYDYIEFEIEHKETFEESVHKTFFAFLETYYKKTQESKIFLATKY